jgi:hypothetical protein
LKLNYDINEESFLYLNLASSTKLHFNRKGGLYHIIFKPVSKTFQSPKIFSPTITPTRRPTPRITVTPTPTQQITPTPRTIINPTIPPDVIVTFYVEKVRDAIEGSTSGQFRVWTTQTGPTTVNAWVQIGFTLSGTAIIGTDYSVGRFASIGHDPPNTIYVKVGNPGPLPTANHEQDNIQINAYPDTLIEGTETVTVTLTGVTVGAGMGSATLDILDGPVVTTGPTATPTPTRRPTPTLAPPSTATPTPTPRPGGYVVSYAVQNDWGNGATVSVSFPLVFFEKVTFHTSNFKLHPFYAAFFSTLAK